MIYLYLIGESLFLAGTWLRMITDILNRPEPAKPRRRGRPKQDSDARRTACAIALSEGLPQQLIADRLGVHRITVYRWCRSENAA